MASCDTATSDIAPRGARQLRGWLQAVLDRPLTSYHLVLGSASMLLALGLMMVLSASSVSAYLTFDDAYYYVKRQAMFMVVGVVGAVALARLPHSVLRVLGWFGVALATVMLILTYTALGFESGGNRNWLDLGVTTIQPSEFAKLAMIIWGADVLARKDKLLERPQHLLFPYLPVCAALILLVVFQGDAGTAVVMASIMVGVLFIVGTPIGCCPCSGCSQSAAWSRSSSPARSGCGGWLPSWTPPPTSTGPTTRRTPACGRSPPAAGGGSDWAVAGRSGAGCRWRTRTSSSPSSARSSACSAA